MRRRAVRGLDPGRRRQRHASHRLADRRRRNRLPSRSAVHSAAVIAFPTAVAGFAAGAGLA